MKKQCSNCEFTKVTSLLGSRASGVQVQVLSPAPQNAALNGLHFLVAPSPQLSASLNFCESE